jgi:hypothetical protein
LKTDRKFLDPIKTLNQVADAKSTYNNLNISNKHAEKEITKTIPFTIASTKTLSINVTKEMKDF